MWRVDRDESYFSSADRLAWHHVLPEKHIPIIDRDIIMAGRLSKFLSLAFDEEELSEACKRLGVES